MQNDNTLKEPEDGEAYREMEISDALTLRVYADRMILDMPDPDEPTTFIPVATISSVDGMELAKFIVHLLPIGQRLKVAASLTTGVANAIG